jgi:hypothetical protein
MSPVPKRASNAVIRLRLFAERANAVFFVRDGVLNVDKDYLHSIDELDWVPVRKGL